MPEWSDAAYDATLRAFLGEGADADQPDEVRFARAVQRIVSRRNDVAGAAAVPSVFLLARVPEALIEESAHAWMLDTGEVPIEGSIWFLGPSPASGRFVSHRFDQDFNALLAHVADDLRLGTVAAVVLLPSQVMDTVRVFPRGLSDGDFFEDLVVSPVPVTLDRACDVLDRLHSNQLVTPIAQSEGNKLWEDAENFIPVRKAELSLQSYVETALWAALWNCKIKVEDSGVAGRLDVGIWGLRADGGVRCAVVLELKVLRSRRSSGAEVNPTEIRTWVADGLDQAHAYAQEQKALEAALCCFDMRREFTGDGCFVEVQARAVGLGVALRAWHLFGRVKDYRAHQAALALAD